MNIQAEPCDLAIINLVSILGSATSSLPQRMKIRKRDSPKKRMKPRGLSLYVLRIQTGPFSPC